MSIREIGVEELDANAFIEEQTQAIRNAVGEETAISALSGGVDSAVVTMLGLLDAIGCRRRWKPLRRISDQPPRQGQRRLWRAIVTYSYHVDRCAARQTGVDVRRGQAKTSRRAEPEVRARASFANAKPQLNSPPWKSRQRAIRRYWQIAKPSPYQQRPSFEETN